MSESNFIELVRKLRETQKEYFKTRNFSKLEESKAIEKQVDAFLKNNPASGQQSFKFEGENNGT